MSDRSPIEEFSDREDAIDFLATNALSGLRFASAERQHLAQGIVDLFAVDELLGPPGDRRLMNKSKKWVVRSKDLQLIDAIGGILQGSAAGGALIASTGSLPLTLLAPAIAVLTYLAKIAFNVRDKGVSLEPVELNILCRLKEAKSGLDVQQLIKELNTLSPEQTLQSVNAHLDKLQNCHTRSGENISLVWKSSNERWFTNDV